MWKHENYINNANHIIGLYVNTYGYDYNKIVSYFRENDLFKFKTDIEFSEFMKNNSFFLNDVTLYDIINHNVQICIVYD